jgi:hypothetical protein
MWQEAPWLHSLAMPRRHNLATTAPTSAGPLSTC